MSEESRIKYSIGQIIHHKMFKYRGVIVDVDPVFSNTDQWYEQVALSRPPRDKPWYHVLVDGANHSTYVAERNLEPDVSGDPVEHPLINEFFSGLHNGAYRPRNIIN